MISILVEVSPRVVVSSLGRKIGESEWERNLISKIGNLNFWILGFHSSYLYSFLVLKTDCEQLWTIYKQNKFNSTVHDPSFVSWGGVHLPSLSPLLLFLLLSISPGFSLSLSFSSSSSFYTLRVLPTAKASIAPSWPSRHTFGWMPSSLSHVPPFTNAVRPSWPGALEERRKRRKRTKGDRKGE